MSRKELVHTYEDIISVENLLKAWKEFVHGKKSRKDVGVFQARLMDNILDLHMDLKHRTYMHGGYEAFTISDPKSRNIHKASVRDRLIHHALYRILYPFFDRTFISDSFSCRRLKGTHRALDRFRVCAYKVSKNHTETLWVLKCDVRKFFASINQNILLGIMKEYIPDKDVLALISEIVSSFSPTCVGVGLPLGNLTSQLFVNIYMNEFDQFVKHRFKVKYYIRYADDFVILSWDKEYLENIITELEDFLWSRLRLTLHPKKISIRTLASGVDYLGWVHFPHYRILRTTTKKRMFRNIQVKEGKKETVQSYLGLLKHGNAWKLQQQVEEMKQQHYS